MMGDFEEHKKEHLAYHARCNNVDSFSPVPELCSACGFLVEAETLKNDNEFLLNSRESLRGELKAEIEQARKENYSDDFIYAHEKKLEFRRALQRIYILYLNDGHMWLDPIKTLDEIGVIVKAALAGKW